MGFPPFWANVQTMESILDLEIQIQCSAQKFIYPSGVSHLWLKMAWKHSGHLQNSEGPYWKVVLYYLFSRNSINSFFFSWSTRTSVKQDGYPVFSPAPSVAEQQGQTRGKPSYVRRLMWGRLNVFPWPGFGITCLWRTMQKIYWCSSFSCTMPNGSSKVPFSCPSPSQKKSEFGPPRGGEMQVCACVNLCFSWRNHSAYPEECLSPVAVGNGRESGLRKKKPERAISSPGSACDTRLPSFYKTSWGSLAASLNCWATAEVSVRPTATWSVWH